jgi:Multicopper oxidase
MKKQSRFWLPILLVGIATVGASAQSFRVQCPTSTITHPQASDAEPAYTAPTAYTCSVTGGCAGSGVLNAGTSNTGYLVPVASANGAIKCQQISGGDGYSTMADGTQTYMFSFGPLSGLAAIANGQPGTQFPGTFNTVYTPAGSTNYLMPGDPATTDGASDSGSYTGWTGYGSNSFTPSFNWNGAVGLAPEVPHNATIYDINGVANGPAPNTINVTVVLNIASPFQVGDQIQICGTGAALGCTGPYDGTYSIITGDLTAIANAAASFGFSPNYAFQATGGTFAGQALADVLQSSTASASSVPVMNGHVDARQIMDVGAMNGNIPAPLMAIDEDDEFFLTLTNVGMIMRPDLFEQHTVHFHGYPNASSFYDGVPDASVAINIGGSFTYYYLAPDAGTYFWHCHITPPEHLQMGMVGQLYVRPRQDRVPASMTLYAGLNAQQHDLRTACNSSTDILCSNPLPAGGDNGTKGGLTIVTGGTGGYAYNDGDGSTWYDVEYPLQMHGFDPNFHFVGMTFNPEGFTDMKDKYFLLNGRSYPDTVADGPQATQSVDGSMHYSQPLNAIIAIPHGGRALLRISNLSVSEYHTLASLGVPMHVIGYNAKLLRDQAGNNMDYYTNSITLGGGESLDVILDACTVARGSDGSCGSPVPKGTYYLYTPNLDHLSNDAENFGGEMTEVRVN